MLQDLCKSLFYFKQNYIKNLQTKSIPRLGVLLHCHIFRLQLCFHKDHVHRTSTTTGAAELFQIDLHSLDIIFNYRILICLAMHILNIKCTEN